MTNWLHVFLAAVMLGCLGIIFYTLVSLFVNEPGGKEKRFGLWTVLLSGVIFMAIAGVIQSLGYASSL